jgi:hypothetical protein
MPYDLRRRQGRDDLRTLVARRLAADRADEARERLARAAASQEPMLEAGSLRGRADHADIGRVAPPERRIGKTIIERVALGEDNKSRACRCLGDQRLGVVDLLERDRIRERRGGRIAIVDQRRRHGQERQRLRQSKSHMAGTEEQSMRPRDRLSGLDLRKGGQLGISGSSQEQLHSSTAALAEMRAERQIEPSFAGSRSDHLPRHIDRVEFELPAADRAMAGIERHQHDGAGLARGRAFGTHHRNEDRRFARRQRRAQMGGKEAHATPSPKRADAAGSRLAFISSTASSTRSGVAGASRRGQKR